MEGLNMVQKGDFTRRRVLQLLLQSNAAMLPKKPSVEIVNIRH